MKKYLAVTILLVIALCCCTRKIYVPAESKAIRSDTVNLFRTEREYIHDTDTLMLYMRGDTVFRDNIKWRTRTATVHDSVYVAVHDTLHVKEPYPVEKIVEVERKRAWWETALIAVGSVSLLALSVYIAYMHRRRRK